MKKILFVYETRVTASSHKHHQDLIVKQKNRIICLFIKLKEKKLIYVENYGNIEWNAVVFHSNMKMKL